MVPSNGEVTNAELARRLEAFSREVHGDLTEILRRLEAYVLREVYAANETRREDQVQALNDRLVAERKERDRELDRIRAQTRWLWTAVIMPVAALILSIVMQTGS